MFNIDTPTIPLDCLAISMILVFNESCAFVNWGSKKTKIKSKGKCSFFIPKITQLSGVNFNPLKKFLIQPDLLIL